MCGPPAPPIIVFFCAVPPPTPNKVLCHSDSVLDSKRSWECGAFQLARWSLPQLVSLSVAFPAEFVVKLLSKFSQTWSWLCFTHVTTRTPTKIYQKEVYYRLEIWHRDLTHKIKTRWSTMDGQPPFLGWSPTIPWMVTHHPKSTRRKSTTDMKFDTKT